MIICDRNYLRELERRTKAIRRSLPLNVAEGIDAEIEAVEALGDPWYSVDAIATAFNVTKKGVEARMNLKHRSFQGHLPEVEGLRQGHGHVRYGTWLDAAAVNKSTQRYRTWEAPDDAIKALQVSHRLHRYGSQLVGSLNTDAQTRIDRWRLGDHGTVSEGEKHDTGI